jgi:hypothetical protein
LATLREELRVQVLLSASQRMERAAIRADHAWTESAGISLGSASGRQ